MAKFDSIIKFTGNLDDMVGMKGANGQTYIRKNVKPTDPKTASQIETRTKVSLAGQISKLTPPSAIVGLGGSKRERRNRFMKLMLKNMSIQTNNEGAKVAMLPPENLIFSEGREFPIAVQISAAEGTARGIVVRVDSGEKARIQTAGVESVIVICVWSDQHLVYHFMDVQSVSVENLGTNGVTSLSLLEKCNVYIIPVLPTDGGNRAEYLAGVERMEDEGYSVAAELIAKDVITLGQSAFKGVGENTQP